MVKHIKIENLFRNVCIQHIENVKNCFFNIKFLFYFPFLIYLTIAPGAPFSMTLIIINMYNSYYECPFYLILITMDTIPFFLSKITSTIPSYYECS
jgi:hypothetical protein